MSTPMSVESERDVSEWLDAGNECLVVRIEGNRIVESYSSVPGLRIHIARDDDDVLPDSRCNYTTEVSADAME